MKFYAGQRVKLKPYRDEFDNLINENMIQWFDSIVTLSSDIDTENRNAIFTITEDSNQWLWLGVWIVTNRIKIELPEELFTL